MKKIGITTTVPVEIIIAAGYIPVDLNNLFITSNNYLKYIEIAEKDGFPKSMCSWIKGIYGAIIENNIELVVGVIEGDCSNTKSLIEILKLKGIKIVEFGFPRNRNINNLKKVMDKFALELGTTIEAAEKIKKELFNIRELLIKIDNLTVENKISGFENHLNLVSSSDFNGNYKKFEAELKTLFETTKVRPSLNKDIKIAYIGVPPMFGEIYDYIESLGGIVIYNEVQREFSFPRHKDSSSLYEQYIDYTYPYSLNFRYEIIKREIEKRNIDCVIHYTQSFCHKSIDNIYFKNMLKIPLLNIEGDRSCELDSRTKLRIESFIDMVRNLKLKKVNLWEF